MKTHTHTAVRLTSHHGDHAGSVDVGERAELSDSQDGLHVGGATSLPKLTDLVVHGCRGRHETEITRRVQCTPMCVWGGTLREGGLTFSAALMTQTEVTGNGRITGLADGLFCNWHFITY